MATYSITTLLENAGLTENVEAQIELEMLDDDGDGILSEDQYEAAQKILRDHERFAQSFDGEKERATALRSAGQRFAPSASTAMSQAAAKNGEPVDYASPDLDPFYNRRTEEELGAILADPDAFRQYVIAQGLEAAFLDENDDLVYDGMTVAEFYEILGSVYDETGEVKTSTSQVEIPDFSFSRIQRDKPWFDVNMPSEEFAAAFREAFTAESPNAVAEEDISLLVEAMDRLDGRFDGVIAELDLGAGQVAAYLVSGFTKGYTMADMFSLLGNPENLSPAQQKNHAEIADGCQQALIQLQEAGLMSVRVPWNQQTDWRWQILGVLGEEMAAGASGYSGAAFNVDQAFTDLAGIMEMADARGVSFGEAYQAYTDYGEATRQNRLTRQEWLESAWREFPQEGGNRLPLSDNRVEVDVKPSNIGLLLHAVGKKDPKAAESALKNLPVVEIDGPGAEIRCYQPRNFESTGPTPYLIVQSDEHAFKINGQVYSNPGIYVFNSEGRYQFALADKSRDLSFEDGPETALINSENNLAMFTAGRLMAEADLSRIRGDQAAYEKSMLALGSEFRKFSSYGAAEAGYQTIMDPLGVNSSAARTALADMKGKGTYDLADHTKDVLTREAVTAVALMVGAGEVGLVSRFVGEAGLTFLARRMLVDTTAKRVMARILTSKVTQQASGSLFMAYGLNGTLAAIEYGRTGKTGYDGIGDFMKQGVRLATEMGIAGGVGRGVTKLAGGGAGLLGESAAFTGIGAGFSHTETFRKQGETPVGWGELDDAFVESTKFILEMRATKSLLSASTGGKYDELVRDTQLKLEQERARVAMATQIGAEISPEHRREVLAVLDAAAKEHPELKADADRVRAELARNEKLPAENRSSVPNEVPEITQAGPRGPGSRGRRRSEPKFVDRFTEDNIQTMPPDLRGRLAALKEGKSLDLETDFARITRTEGKYHLSNISKDKTLYLKKDGNVYEFHPHSRGERRGITVHLPNDDSTVVDVLSLPLSGGDIIYFEDPLVAQKQNRVPSAMIFQAPPVAPPVPKEVPRQRQVRAPQGASFKVGAEDVLVRDEAGNFVQGYWRITDIEGDRITLTDKSLSPGRTITVDVKTLESWQRVTTMTIERGELFVAGDKTKYAGRLEFFKDTDGTNKVLLTDEKNGRRTTFLFKNVTSYRPRGEDLTTQFIRVPDPQFGDKSVNKSGLKGEGQWVLVDFSDPKLAQFLKTNMDPIYADLQSGSVTPEEAAIAANDAIIANVRFDEFGETPDDLVNLAKFLDQGVCNEMSMLLQVSLQYLGVGSRMEKGPFGEGRHAWVRLTDPRASPLVLDPAMKRVTAPSDARHYERYVDDETPFAQRGMKTVAVLHSSPEEAIPPEAWSKKDSENTESGPAPTEMPEKIEALPVEKTESIPKWEVGELTVRGGGLPLEFGPRPDEAVVVGAKMLGSPERTEVGEKITVEVEGEISEVALEKPPPEGTAPMIKPHRASGAEPAKRAVASASSIEKPQAVERDSPFVAFLRGAGRLFGQVRKGLFPQRLPERPPDELPKIPATKGPKPVLEAEFSDEYTDDIIATTRRSGPRDAEANRAMLNDVSRRQQLETAATALRQAGLSARLAEQTGIPARDITALYRTPLNRALVTEHSLFHFKDGTLSVTKGGLNSTESVLLEAGDETSALAGAVRELDFTAHLHLGEPRPSDEDFGIVMARARLNPGEAQRHTVFGTIDGEPAFVQLAVIHENGGIKTSLTASDNISDDSLAEIDMSARRMARLIESKSGEEALEAAFHPAAMAPKVTVDHYRQELDGLADSEALDDLMKRSMPDAERTKVMIEWHSLWQNYVIDRYPEIDEAVNAFERGLFKSDKSTQARPLNRQIRDFRDSCDFLSGGMGMSPAEITKVFKGDYGPPARFIEGIGFLKEHGISNEDIKAVMTNPATMTDLANSATKAEKGAEVVKDIHRQILAGARDPVNGQFVSSMYATQTRLLLDVANIAATFNDPAYAEQFIRGQQGLILNPALDDAVKRRQIQASLSQPHVINDFLIRSMGRYADILEGVGNNSARTYLDGLRTGISHGDARSKDLAMDFIMSANAIREGRLKAVLKNPHWDAALLETFFREAAYSAQSHGGKSPDFLKRVAANIAQQDARGGFALQNRGTIEGYLLELEIFNLIAGHGKLISTPDGGNLLPSQIPAKIDYQVSDVADPSLVGIEYRDPVTGTTLTSPLDMDVIVDSNPPLEYVEVKRTVRGGDDKQNRQREKIRMATKLKLTEKPGCITTGIDPRFAQQLIRDGTYEYVVVIGLNPATRQYQIVDVYGNNPRIGNEPVHTGDTFAPAPHIGIGNFPYTL